MRYVALVISLLIFTVISILTKRMDDLSVTSAKRAFEDFIPLSGSISVDGDIANGEFQFNLIDIFSNFRNNEKLHDTLKAQLAEKPRGHLHFSQVQLPRNGYFNFKAMFILGDMRREVRGIGFRNLKDIEMKISIDLEDLNLTIPEEFAGMIPQKLNIIGYVDI